eukprot:1138006-Pelagomonas_calceolata.AAC.6
MHAERHSPQPDLNFRLPLQIDRESKTLGMQAFAQSSLLFMPLMLRHRQERPRDFQVSVQSGANQSFVHKSHTAILTENSMPSGVAPPAKPPQYVAGTWERSALQGVVHCTNQNMRLQAE